MSQNTQAAAATKSKFSVRDICYAGLFAAVIAVMAQISIPMPLGVPMTMQTFAITLAAVVLGSKLSAIASLVYLALGAVGVPVLDVEDFLVSNLFLPLGSLVYLLFCVTRYGWGWDNYKKEVNTGKGLKMHDWMRGYLTYGLPLIVLFIFVFGLYDKFIA